MPGKHLYEYAVIRVVPRVEREEFLNAGVILYCRDLRFLNCIVELDTRKLLSFSANACAEEVRTNLDSFSRICNGKLSGGPIAALDTASRFRWLTATRSTVIQSSKVHAGFCTEPEQTLSRLFQQLVGNE